MKENVAFHILVFLIPGIKVTFELAKYDSKLQSYCWDLSSLVSLLEDQCYLKLYLQHSFPLNTGALN